VRIQPSPSTRSNPRTNHRNPAGLHRGARASRELIAAGAKDQQGTQRDQGKLARAAAEPGADEHRVIDGGLHVEGLGADVQGRSSRSTANRSKLSVPVAAVQPGTGRCADYPPGSAPRDTCLILEHETVRAPIKAPILQADPGRQVVSRSIGSPSSGKCLTEPWEISHAHHQQGPGSTIPQAHS